MTMPPDIVLPAQYASRAGSSPERRLMVAVLTDAVQTWEKSPGPCTGCGRPPRDEVDAWFASDDVGWPFAFLSICHHLGFDPGYIRSGIARLPRLPPNCACGSNLLGDAPAAGHSPTEAIAAFLDDSRSQDAIADDGAVG